MAKSRNRNATSDVTNNGMVRVTAVNPRVRSAPSSTWPQPLRNLSVPLFLIEDRRTYHPDGPFRFPRATFQGGGKLVVKGSRNVDNVGGTGRAVRGRGFYPSPVVVAAVPDRVAVCVKRKRRREVLFAKGVGGGKVRKGKRNYQSNYYC